MAPPLLAAERKYSQERALGYAERLPIGRLVRALRIAKEKSASREISTHRRLDSVSEFWQVQLGQQRCPSLADDPEGVRERPVGKAVAGETSPWRLEQPGLAQNFGWQEGCLLDMIGLGAAAPGWCPAEGVRPPKLTGGQQGGNR
jgi:hypothetical protein